MSKSEEALARILKMIETGTAENCQANEIKCANGTIITGDAAGEIIEFVRDIEDLARDGLNLPAKAQKAA